MSRRPAVTLGLIGATSVSSAGSDSDGDIGGRSARALGCWRGVEWAGVTWALAAWCLGVAMASWRCCWQPAACAARGAAGKRPGRAGSGIASGDLIQLMSRMSAHPEAGARAGARARLFALRARGQARAGVGRAGGQVVR